MGLISFRIDDKLKKKMEELKHINWSEVVRKAIAQRIQLEESLKSTRKIDLKAMRKAAEEILALRDKTSGRWSGAEEIRKWRELRR